MEGSWGEQATHKELTSDRTLACLFRTRRCWSRVLRPLARTLSKKAEARSC